MKNWLVFILLLCHVNFTMFIAQVDEVDVFDRSGRQLDDINSLAEYIYDSTTGNHHHNRNDEDDDTPRFFHLEKTIDYTCWSQMIEIRRTDIVRTVRTHCPPRPDDRLSSAFTEAPTPPPKAG